MKGANLRKCVGAGVLVLLTSLAISAQDASVTRVMAAVRLAMSPALPFSDTDKSGVFPADGKTEPPWMVRPPEPGIGCSK